MLRKEGPSFCLLPRHLAAINYYVRRIRQELLLLTLGSNNFWHQHHPLSRICMYVLWLCLTAWQHPYVLRPRPELGGTPTWHFSSFRAARKREKERRGDPWARSRGAGDGNRTRVTSLEGWCSAIELRRRMVQGADTARPLRVARLSEPPTTGKKKEVSMWGVFLSPRCTAGGTRTRDPMVAHARLPTALRRRMAHRAGVPSPHGTSRLSGPPNMRKE